MACLWVVVVKEQEIGASRGVRMGRDVMESRPNEERIEDAIVNALVHVVTRKSS